MALDDLLDSLEMLHPDRFPGTALGKPSQRAEDRFGSRRQKPAELTKAAQFRPDQREEIFFQRLHFPRPAPQPLLCVRQSRGKQLRHDSLLRFEIIEKRSRGDAGPGSDVARGRVFPTLAGKEFRGGVNDPLPGFSLRFGRDPHRGRLPKLSMLIK